MSKVKKILGNWPIKKSVITYLAKLLVWIGEKGFRLIFLTNSKKMNTKLV
jgi:hypothetical protein